MAALIITDSALASPSARSLPAQLLGELIAGRAQIIAMSVDVIRQES